MLKLLKHLSPKEWLFAFFSLCVIVLQVWVDLKMPEYMSEITQIATTGSGKMNDILVNGGFMLACAIGSAGCSVICGLFIAKIAAGYSARLRKLLYDKVQTFSPAEINKFSTASLITRSTNDVQQVQMLVAVGLQMMMKAPITAVWAICKIAGKEWQWTVATAVTVAFMLLAFGIIILLVFRKFKKMQRLTDELNRTTRENLSGIRVIRAYNAEKYQEDKFKRINDEFTATNLFTGRTMAALMPVILMVMNGLSLAIYWIGAIIINGASNALQGYTLFSDMVVFMSYGMQIVSAFMMLTMVFMFAPRAFVSANRINEVLKTENSVKDGEGVGETEESGTVEFKHVYFRYPDSNEDMLSDINFRAENGQTVAFIGSTGCGKSTVVNLVSRFYDVSEGQVLVDGRDVRDYKKSELNKKIGYVSQKAVLFSGTVSENVDFGDNDADREDIEKAVAIAQSTDFIEAQEGGYDGRVAQNGSNFSGGQKQRISIARAIARNAEIYIFDDTFSALDYKTDRNLRNAIKREMGETTSLIVAQRIGTIKDADKIIVLDDGKIVGEGTHTYLLANCPTYRNIAESQLSDEELKRDLAGETERSTEGDLLKKEGDDAQ